MAASAVIDALWPGKPYPRGATWDGMGVNFALFSESAERVELCLFDASGRNEIARLALREQTDQVFHGYLRRLAMHPDLVLPAPCTDGMATHWNGWPRCAACSCRPRTSYGPWDTRVWRCAPGCQWRPRPCRAARFGPERPP